MTAITLPWMILREDGREELTVVRLFLQFCHLPAGRLPTLSYGCPTFTPLAVRCVDVCRETSTKTVQLQRSPRCRDPSIPTASPQGVAGGWSGLASSSPSLATVAGPLIVTGPKWPFNYGTVGSAKSARYRIISSKFKRRVPHWEMVYVLYLSLSQSSSIIINAILSISSRSVRFSDY